MRERCKRNARGTILFMSVSEYDGSLVVVMRPEGVKGSHGIVNIFWDWVWC